MPADHECLLSRRRLFLLAGAGIAARLPLGAATSPDFWNKKAPAEWTNEEIDRLIAKSPWSKPVKATYAPGEAPYDDQPRRQWYRDRRRISRRRNRRRRISWWRNRRRIPWWRNRRRISRRHGPPRIGIPGLGGLNIPGMGRGRKGGGAASAYEGTVRWESARPILDAMKAPLPEAFEGRYVISVSGIPLMDSRYHRRGRRGRCRHGAPPRTR